ncbi:hypothetical protein, partial [Pseudomonas syringae]|uniref:hypothetical protein n=1 Tax=Pseudomonas syringae TaxID=317 RepID=UPI001C808EBE
FSVSLTILDTALPEQLNRRSAKNSKSRVTPAKIRKIRTSALVVQKQPLPESYSGVWGRCEAEFGYRLRAEE